MTSTDDHEPTSADSPDHVDVAVPEATDTPDTPDGGDPEAGSGWEAEAWDDIEAGEPARREGLAGAQAAEHTGAAAPQNEPVLGRFVGVAGADAGNLLRMTGPEASVGRGHECSLVLADASASREHARIYYDGRRFLLTDLGSGNGTEVNGERIQKFVLASGDRVTFGRSVFRFEVVTAEVDPVPRPDVAAPAPPPRHRVLARRALLGVVVGIAIIVSIILTSGQQRADEVFQVFETGVTAFKKRDWGQARENFSRVLAFDSTHGPSRRYLEAIAKAEDGAGQLKAARRAVGARQFGAATKILDELAVRYTWAEIHEVNALLDASVARELVKIEGLLERGRTERARELVASLAPAVEGRPDFARLRSWAHSVSLETRVSAGMSGPSTVAKPPPPAAATRPKATAPSRRRKPKPAVQKGPLLPVPQEARPAVELFQSGEVPAALDRLEGLLDDDAPVLIAMRAFERFRSQGMEAYRAKRTPSAIARFVAARKHAQKLAPETSAVIRDLDRRLADMYYVQGASRSLAGRLPEAYAAFKKALSLKSSHRGARRKLSEFRGKAESIYADTVVKAPRDPKWARAVLQMLIEILPARDPIRRRAEADLRRMKP